ncbi:Lrp/AsnC family transcriptional regulator [Aquabacterium sp.]|uniref:siroheme decarboxylase subunit beta n=1 Tax=Aquabacterium sp. TaxID=1872578 RepID=UPI0035B1EBAA
MIVAAPVSRSTPAADPVDEHALEMALLNDWQRDFPLTSRPFDVIAARYGVRPTLVQDSYRSLQATGAVSRIGGVFGVGAGGSAMLCAFAVPHDRMAEVVALVNACPGVNHNYEREHHWNLWFVITAPSAVERDAAVAKMEQQTGLRALHLPMRRAFRIDLGFDLYTGACPAKAQSCCAPLPPEDHALAAAVEQGLPLADQPYALWAEQAGCDEVSVLRRLETWLTNGALRRFGAIVRHHELGLHANAMTVFNVPDEELAAAGERLARQTGITLCYARSRDEGWPYNLYCMVHGRSREDAQSLIELARVAAGLTGYEHAVLFSTKRYKQTGARYFRAAA